MLLILKLNKGGDKILPCGTPCSCLKVSDNVQPCGTPCSCLKVSDNVQPILTLKDLSDKKFDTNSVIGL